MAKGGSRETSWNLACAYLSRMAASCVLLETAWCTDARATTHELMSAGAYAEKCRRLASQGVRLRIRLARKMPAAAITDGRNPSML